MALGRALGLEILERIESFLPQVLIAERDYLEALLLLITLLRAINLSQVKETS